MKALITRKIGMTSVIDEDGAALAVTLLSASPNVVTQIKTDEKDGYDALQLGFEETKRPSKSQSGQSKHLKKTPKIRREFRIDKLPQDISIGSEVTADLFSVGDRVRVTGISKGKGFAGTIKRHNFHHGPKSHGGRSYRRPGSIGSMFPQRIFPGKKMAGRMGHNRTTTKNLKVVLVNKDLDVIGLAGAIPGPRKGLVLLRGAE